MSIPRDSDGVCPGNYFREIWYFGTQDPSFTCSPRLTAGGSRRGRFLAGQLNPMLSILQVLTVVFVAFAMAPALAHAFELPGKMRLAKDQYFAVQRIYYPGFTIAGIDEPAGFISTIALLFSHHGEL
jgi:hypothetical protein